MTVETWSIWTATLSGMEVSGGTRVLAKNMYRLARRLPIADMRINGTAVNEAPAIHGS